jgi:hypothetical protein
MSVVKESVSLFRKGGWQPRQGATISARTDASSPATTLFSPCICLQSVSRPATIRCPLRAGVLLNGILPAVVGAVTCHWSFIQPRPEPGIPAEFPSADGKTPIHWTATAQCPRNRKQVSKPSVTRERWSCHDERKNDLAFAIRPEFRSPHDRTSSPRYRTK